MAFCSFPDVFSWMENLPPILQLKKDMNINSLNLCDSTFLNLSIKNLNNVNSFSLSIDAVYNNISIILWTSRKFVAKSTSNKLLIMNETTSTLLINNFIQDVLKYSPMNKSSSSFKLPRSYSSENNLKDIFNFSFLCLVFIICIYEAPSDVRASCLNTLKDEIACSKSREVAKAFMRLLGSNIEEKWVRSINLGITHWISEIRDGGFEMPHTLFTYSISAFGLWKVQFYSPVIAMDIDKSSGLLSEDDRLMFSLNNNQLEGVIQLNYKVNVQEKWIEVMVNIDNIRCDVNKLLSDKIMNERGAGTLEKHFPSRISLQITPTVQTNIISISVSKSSENPSTEIGAEKGIGASFEAPKGIGLNFSASETMSMSLKPWKFEQSVYANSANLNWFLHDSVNGREVYSSKPSKCSLLHPKAWFKNRYSNANRVFTRKGGVIFAGDEYGDSVSWKVDKDSIGKSMEWEIRGWIWLTYWPNKLMSLYTETKKLEFKENVCLTLL